MKKDEFNFFTVFFHDFDLNLQQVENKQYEQMRLIVFEKLHKFVEQAKSKFSINIKSKFARFFLLL